jgi:hypothetical protein
MRQAALARWAPLAVTVAFAATLLLRAGTDPLDLVRYALYVVFAVLLPGTLVYRGLRPRPHTLVEDLSMGAAIGLALEIPAWALFSALDLRGWVWLWPVLVVAPFALIPKLRKHFTPRGYARVPLGWSWSVAAVVCFFTAYLAIVFIDRNPILPTSESTRQYLDLAYQLSLAGDAKHHIPLNVPQVAGEPLDYHWFGYAHMAMTSLVGHIDLPVVALRLTVPGLCAAAVVGTAVVGWRVSGRPYVGAVAAALFFAVGEFSFTDPVDFPFGTQATFVVWHGMSMIYSWVLLIALILPLAQIVRQSWRPSHASSNVERRRGAYVVAAMLLFASSGAKASTLPVVAGALLVTALLMLVVGRRIPWGVVGIGLVTGAAQAFAIGVLFRFHPYGTSWGPLQGLATFWADDQNRGAVAQSIVVGGVWVAFGLNMLLRYAGMAPLLISRRGSTDPAAWLLVAGGLAGPVIYLLVSQASGGNQYFTRSGFAFGVIASAWGYGLLFDRARLTAAGKVALAVGASVFVLAVVWANFAFATAASGTAADAQLRPILSWAWLLTIIGAVVGLAWWFAGYRWPFLRGRGSLVALTAVLLAGAPGLIMDERKSLRYPNGGAYAPISLPQSRVDAARWVRDHSSPDDILATNAHCIGYFGKLCDPRSFWLSAYAERRVLVEGWAFAPRLAINGIVPFWDPAKLAANDAAFTDPTVQSLADLRTQYGVRWLVVDRQVAEESPQLAGLAHKVYDNRRIAIYEL